MNLVHFMYDIFLNRHLQYLIESLLMNQQGFLDLAYEGWIHLKDNYLNVPEAGFALVVIVFAIAIYSTLKEQPKFSLKRNIFEQSISAFSSTERLQESFKSKKYEATPKDLAEESYIPQITRKPSATELKQQETTKQRVRKRYLTPAKRTLLYETIDEKRAELQRKEREDQQLKDKERRKKEEQKRKEQLAKEQKEKQLKQKEAKLNQQKKKVEFKEDRIDQIDDENQQPSQRSVRSGERKTTIQLVVDQNQQKAQEQKPQTSKTFSLFNNSTAHQMGSLFNPSQTETAINNPSVPSTGFIGTTNQFLSNPITSIKMTNEPIQSNAPKIDLNMGSKPSLFQNLSQPQNVAPKQAQRVNPSFGNQPNRIIPVHPQPSQPSQPSQPVRPVATARQQVALSGEEYFEQLMKFAQSQTATVQIPTLMANLGGAKSSLNDLLTFAQSFIDTINKTDDSQLTTFSIKIYDGIVRQISTSNLKDGIYRIPPKSKTDQVQKNSINCYILYINLYRQMGFEKVWAIVFGKLLKLLEFIYKRKQDLKKYTQLELLANKHLQKRGELEGKYLSRIDYLTYLLFGLTAFDPIMVFRQTQEKQQNVRESREKIESWGREWSYKEFWILTDLFLKNKHDSYFKPIIHMNLLSALYPRIYANKQNPDRFKAENQLYKLILDQGKKYFSKFKTIPELKNLKTSEEGNGFEYDGDNFVQDIKVLESRLTVEKVKEFNAKIGDNYANARDFQSKSNVFYYFSKEK